ncbi:transposase [Bacillus thuringiensis]|nr:transposase [Bacillus thuringiensis]
MNAFACPMGCILEYATTDREGYHQYKSNPEDYAVCPLREVCFSKKQKLSLIIYGRNIRISLEKQTNSYREKVLQSTLFNYRAKLCGRQRTTWLSICSISGLKSVQMQAYLTATCQNMKK